VPAETGQKKLNGVVVRTNLSGVDPAQTVDGALQGPGGKSMSLLDALKATPCGEPLRIAEEYASNSPSNAAHP
jgi:hypothetical protein